jgi:hypothetical protein
MAYTKVSQLDELPITDVTADNKLLVTDGSVSKQLPAQNILNANTGTLELKGDQTTTLTSDANGLSVDNDVNVAGQISLTDNQEQTARLTSDANGLSVNKPINGHQSGKQTGLKGDGTWNRVCKIQHRNLYEVTVSTDGGDFTPGSLTFHVQTGYNDNEHIDATCISAIGSVYATNVRFTAHENTDESHNGLGFLEIQCSGSEVNSISLNVRGLGAYSFFELPATPYGYNMDKKAITSNICALNLSKFSNLDVDGKLTVKSDEGIVLQSDTNGGVISIEFDDRVTENSDNDPKAYLKYSHNDSEAGILTDTTNKYSSAFQFSSTDHGDPLGVAIDGGLEVKDDVNVAGDIKANNFSPDHVNPAFLLGNSDWSDMFTSTNSDQVSYDSGKKGIVVTGNEEIIFKQPYNIDPNRKYIISVRVKNTGSLDSVFWAGVDTLDQNKTRITTDNANSYNYGVANNVTILPGETYTFTGEFQGYNATADTNRNKFDPTGSFFNIIVLCNYHGDSTVETTIESISLDYDRTFPDNPIEWGYTQVGIQDNRLPLKGPDLITNLNAMTGISGEMFKISLLIKGTAGLSAYGVWHYRVRTDNIADHELLKIHGPGIESDNQPKLERQDNELCWYHQSETPYTCNIKIEKIADSYNYRGSM